MGFTEILTIVFVLLKVFGIVSWSWWVVFLPEIIAIVLYVFLLIVGIVSTHKTTCSDPRWSTWGNEPIRSQRLKQAGYDPVAVQKEVNKLF